MIIDLIRNAGNYYGYSLRLKKALQFLHTPEFLTVKVGRFEIDGSDIYGIVSEYETLSKEKTVFEAHRKYIDVQSILQGEELMGYAPLSSLRLSGYYKNEDDYCLLEGNGSFFTVKPGMFVVFGPEDGHLPGLAVNMPIQVKKLVLKVRI